jgi:hypothetical protein
VIISSGSTRSSAPSTALSTRNFQNLERFERPGSTFWTALREVSVSLYWGRVGQVLRAKRAISFIAHLLSYFRRNPSPRSGLCVSRRHDRLQALAAHHRSPVYCRQSINAFAEAEVRAALIGSLSSEVIQPLIDLKVCSLSFLRSVSYLSLK